MVDAARRVCRNLGLRILELRKERDLTQEALAEKLDIDARELRRLESGDNTTVHTLVNLASAFDVPIVALFEQPKTTIKRRTGRPKKKMAVSTTKKRGLK